MARGEVFSVVAMRRGRRGGFAGLSAAGAAISVVATVAAGGRGGDDGVAIAPFTEEAVVRGLIYPMMSPIGYGYLGWGCGFVDLDNDGELDVVLLGRSDGQPGIFENTGGGFFVDRTATCGIPILPQNSGFAPADFNGDGIVDLNFTQLALGNRLFRGLGSFTFSDVTATAGVGDTGAGKGCGWADFDGDGWLDLFIANYDGIVPNTAGKPDRLYRNNGNGTFTDVSVAQGVAATGYGFQISFADIDNDGDPDLYLSQDRGHLNPLQQGNRLWRNDDGNFVEISEGSGANLQFFSMGLAAGDFDRNGFVDFFCTNIAANSGPVGGKFPLLLNQGDNTFLEQSVQWGIGFPNGQTGWGAIFWDFDDDGWLDLYVNVQFQANRLYRNPGAPPLVDVTSQTPLVAGLVGSGKLSFCSAVGDVDGDGDLDLLLNDLGGNVQLLVNHEGEKRNRVRMRVVGEHPNLFAVGARAHLRVGEAWQRQEIYSGGNGYLSQNDSALHFGIGHATQADEVLVVWPGGDPVRTLTNLPANQRWDIYPPARLGDFDGDGKVEIDDFLSFAACFGQSLLPGFEMMDIDGDGDVDEVDAALLSGLLFGEPIDCDGDGVVDLVQILADPSLDLDGDAQLDDCGGPGEPADLDGNGVVDGADLGLLLGNWGGSGLGDLDGSGVVDGADLGLLLGAWSRSG